MALLIGNPSKIHPAIWDHTMLVATQPDRLVIDLPTLEGWKAELTLVLVIPRWFTCPPTVTRLSSNHLIVTSPGVKPTIPDTAKLCLAYLCVIISQIAYCNVNKYISKYCDRITTV